MGRERGRQRLVEAVTESKLGEREREIGNLIEFMFEREDLE